MINYPRMLNVTLHCHNLNDKNKRDLWVFLSLKKFRGIFYIIRFLNIKYIAVENSELTFFISKTTNPNAFTQFVKSHICTTFNFLVAAAARKTQIQKKIF